jgi:hypothetical protein
MGRPGTEVGIHTPTELDLENVLQIPLVSRSFGIELEFTGSRNTVSAALVRQGLNSRVENYNHSVRRHWKITTDESVERGGELVSPILNNLDGRVQVAKACSGLRAAGATTNRSTGFHAHHDVRDLAASEIVRVAKSYYKSQKAIDGLVADSRRSSGYNSYCQPIGEREIQGLEAHSDSLGNFRQHADYVNRFRTLNVECYPRYGTIEFRQHQGTHDANKVLSWVAMGQSLIQTSMDGVLVDTENTFDLLAILGEHGLPHDAGEFLKARARHFEQARYAAR